MDIDVHVGRVDLEIRAGELGLQSPHIKVMTDAELAALIDRIENPPMDQQEFTCPSCAAALRVAFVRHRT